MNIIDIDIADIVIGRAFRKDMGDIDALAKSIVDIGLLQPIAIAPNNELIFGSRRIAAHKQLGRTMITARVLDMDNPLAAQFDENEEREPFTNSERVAIMEAKMKGIGNRQGKRTDLRLPIDRKEVDVPRGMETLEVGAKHVGWSSATASRARTIIHDGVPELVDAVDKGAISIDAAYYIVRDEEPEEQRKIMAMPKQKRAEVVADLRAGKPKPKRKPAAPAFRRPQAEPLPTYWPTPMTDEERGFPPKETWHEPDPDRPGLNKYQGHIAKHGHVHIMPLATRQAQDRRIAARRLNSQLRELVKPLHAFVGSEPPPIDLADLARTLNETTPDNVELVMRRLTAVLAEVMPDLTAAWHYVSTLNDMIAARARVTPEPAAAAGA